jgi:anhydro-N-acetylmuramic acid kinase
MTAQLGDGAAIAAETGLPVVTDLRALDVALGGQGAPIVPIGEKMLWNEYDYFLNIGGIANISARPLPKPLSKGEELLETPNHIKSFQYSEVAKPLSTIGEGGLEDVAYIAFDVCPANRVLNMLANEMGLAFDDGGKIAQSGSINSSLLEKLNQLDYYRQPYPKSLANDFGTDVVYPMIRDSGCGIQDALATYSEHIAVQIRNAITNSNNLNPETKNLPDRKKGPKLLVTGGGALNIFLIEQLKKHLQKLDIEVVVPDANLVSFKEALIMAFIGVLRWRQEYNVLASVTGAKRNSIGGALWVGQEA